MPRSRSIEGFQFFSGQPDRDHLHRLGATSGSAPAATPGGLDVVAGFGLVGMQERVALVGGKVSVESSPGGGTTVHAEIPARRGDGGDGETGPSVRPPADVDQLAG